jgi:hypothetical protein
MGKRNVPFFMPSTYPPLPPAAVKFLREANEHIREERESLSIPEFDGPTANLLVLALIQCWRTEHQFGTTFRCIAKSGTLNHGRKVGVDKRKTKAKARLQSLLRDGKPLKRAVQIAVAERLGNRTFLYGVAKEFGLSVR